MHTSELGTVVSSFSMQMNILNLIVVLKIIKYVKVQLQGHFSTFINKYNKW